MKTLFLLLLTFTTIFAKNGYNYYYYGSQNNLSKTAIVNIATHQVQRLILKKKIPKSWESIKHSSVKKFKNSAGSDWIVDFKNPKIKNKKGQILYIFVGPNGTVKGVKHTAH